MIEKLQYFVGKACTISTIQINFRFKEEQMMDYFMGIVDHIDENCIIITHTITKNKTFIFLKHVVSIAEEQMLDNSVPEHAKIIEEYKKEKTPSPSVPSKFTTSGMPRPTNGDATSPFVNPKSMAELAKKAQETYKKQN